MIETGVEQVGVGEDVGEAERVRLARVRLAWVRLAWLRLAWVRLDG
jgi:hypothetical protein